MKVVRNFILKNELGLHARVAAMMVSAASRYDARLTVEKNGEEVDGKSILSILTLACPKGSEITIKAEGLDAELLVAELEGLIENKFGEA